MHNAPHDEQIRKRILCEYYKYIYFFKQTNHATSAEQPMLRVTPDYTYLKGYS